MVIMWEMLLSFCRFSVSLWSCSLVPCTFASFSLCLSDVSYRLHFENWNILLYNKQALKKKSQRDKFSTTKYYHNNNPLLCLFSIYTTYSFRLCSLNHKEIFSFPFFHLYLLFLSVFRFQPYCNCTQEWWQLWQVPLWSLGSKYT